MKIKNTIALLFMCLILIWEYQSSSAQTNDAKQLYDGCTIGVAAGKATSDGRSLLWKTRDTESFDNEVYYNTSFKYKFITVISAGALSYSWMGVNEKGFAILNSVAYDLGASGVDNGTIMSYALGNCATMVEFEHLLDSTNATGRRTMSNFGVIDTTGAAAIFETGGNQYWKFDANDSNQAPNGYILRTNFSINGGGSEGIERFNRTVKLIGDFYAGDSLNYKSIIRHQMRDFSDFNSNPVPVPYPMQWIPNRPYGYIYTGVSISRFYSASASVIQGVLPLEPAKLSIMWTLLGQPASSIAVPYWTVGDTPEEADGNPTAPLCNVANQIKSLLFDYKENTNYIDSYKLRDETGDGLWARTFPAEDSIFSTTEIMLEKWRKDSLNVEEMLKAEYSLAEYALSILQSAYNELVTSIPADIVNLMPSNFELNQNYPNPFNLTTHIQFSLPYPCYVTIKVINLLGEEVNTLVSEKFSEGRHITQLNAKDMASGVYLYRLYARPINDNQSSIFIDTKKFSLIK